MQHSPVEIVPRNFIQQPNEKYSVYFSSVLGVVLRMKKNVDMNVGTTRKEMKNERSNERKKRGCRGNAREKSKTEKRERENLVLSEFAMRKPISVYYPP